MGLGIDLGKIMTQKGMCVCVWGVWVWTWRGGGKGTARWITKICFSEGTLWQKPFSHRILSADTWDGGS